MGKHDRADAGKTRALAVTMAAAVEYAVTGRSRCGDAPSGRNWLGHSRHVELPLLSNTVSVGVRCGQVYVSLSRPPIPGSVIDVSWEDVRNQLARISDGQCVDVQFKAPIACGATLRRRRCRRRIDIVVVSSSCRHLVTVVSLSWVTTAVQARHSTPSPSCPLGRLQSCTLPPTGTCRVCSISHPSTTTCTPVMDWAHTHL